MTHCVLGGQAPPRKPDRDSLLQRNMIYMRRNTDVVKAVNCAPHNGTNDDCPEAAAPFFAAAVTFVNQT